MATIGIVGTERIRKLKEKMFVQPAICPERGYWLTESYKETESDPPVIRKAKALRKVLDNMTIAIADGELIVGKATSKLRGSAMSPEIRWESYLKELDTVSTREVDPYTLAEEDKARMKEFLPYWKGRTLQDRYRAMISQEPQELGHTGTPAGGPISYPGHTAVDYEKLLARGLNGVNEEVEEELGKLNLANVEDLDKVLFLRAVDITLEAVKTFAKRYADLARSMAENATDVQRKAELEKIAQVCELVPACPAHGLQEALQSVWFTQIAVMNEGWMGGNFGRPDQYLYPFYKRDIEEGRITVDEARELLSLFLVKINELDHWRPEADAIKYAGYTSASGMTLGGLTREGKDAVNELSYLFLEAEMDVRLTNDDFVIRVHKNTSDAFVMKACEVAKELRGKLKFVSDEMNIQRLLKDGRPIEQARDYVITGCWCITVPGRSFDFLGRRGASLVPKLELALNNGVSRLTGKQRGPATGDPRKFKSYDKVWEAYKKQVEYSVPGDAAASNVGEQVFARYFPVPFQSALMHGCIEKGLDIFGGGTAPYISVPVRVRGAPNVADSLAAIKKVVFEDSKITMDKLIDALDKDFEGEDEVLHLLKSAPKFGNDDDYVDSIMNEVLAHASEAAAKIKGFAGAQITGALMAGPTFITEGRQIGALPDGRKAGESLAEGGISPYQGRDINGPTSCLRSVAKIDHMNFTRGDVLNMKFSPDALKGELKMRKFASLIRTHLESGGGLVQFNIVDADTLRDAQKHPEKYRDLLVRVATWSAYFVDLPKEAQDNIIARTEFEEI